MLNIIITLIAVAIVGVILYRECYSWVTIITVSILLLFLGINMGTNLVVGYQSEPIKDTIMLSPIAENESQDTYLIISEEGRYTFKTIQSNEYGIPEEIIKTYSGDNIKYFEETQRTSGILAKYTYKPIKNLFSLGLGEEKVEYVFFVPEGSVLK